MPSWGVWEVGKKNFLQKAGSVKYKAHCMQAPPHTPQQIKVHSGSHASNSYINWDAKISNKLKNGTKKTPFTYKWHWIVGKNYHIPKVVELIFKGS